MTDIHERNHAAITFCDNCGCSWLDDGLNPIGCPYCKQSNMDSVRALIGQWRDAAEFFKGDAGSDIRETLRACARELESALATQQQGPKP